MGNKLEPRNVTSVDIADEYEVQALGAIEELQDPEEAEKLIGRIRLVGEAVRIQKLGEDRERRWHRVALRAKRKHGQLLGPAKQGAPKGSKNAAKNNVTTGNVKSGADRKAVNQDRRVAAVPDDTFEAYVDHAEKPSVAGLLRETSPPRKPSKPRSLLWKDEAVITWVARRLKKKHTRDQMVQDSISDASWPADTPLSNGICDLVRAVVEDRQGRTTVAKSRNWNGKTNATRIREIEAQKRKGNYGDFMKVQHRIAQLCAALQSVNLDDFIFVDPQVVELMGWDVASMHDDLISLGEWHDRALSSVQRWLSDTAVREKIAKLRNTDGRTPEEADTARRLADRLEFKLKSIVN